MMISLPPLSKKRSLDRYSKVKIANSWREPINALTHLLALVLSLVGIALMFIKVIVENHVNVLTLISAIAFGTGLVSLYFASFRYHSKIGSEDQIRRLKKIDHAMIFVLIAGTYTPFSLLCLSGSQRVGMMIVVWSVAVIGIGLKIRWVFMPRWLGTGLYISLGWLAIFVIKPLYLALPQVGFFLLLTGGIMYTIGGLIYAFKKPCFSKNFGFHELFHIFVMLGSLCHFLCIFFYLL